MPSFKQQFDKLTEAYIRGEVNAFTGCECFNGNLENRTTQWTEVKGGKNIISPNVNYTGLQYTEMEHAFMEPIRVFLRRNVHSGSSKTWIDDYNKSSVVNADYEAALFQGFQDAIEILRQIHISRGEEVDDRAFVKRETKNA